MRSIMLATIAAVWSSAVLAQTIEGRVADPAGGPAEQAAAGDSAVADTSDLQALVAPVALYPDPILAMILQASVFPLQVVQADRFLARHEKDPSLTPPDDFDPSIVGLMNYPQLVSTMNEYLDWTEEMGKALVDRTGDIQLAVQDVRAAAVHLGMLKTDDHQKVIDDDGVIRIMPASVQSVTFPRYDPAALLDAMAQADQDVATLETAAAADDGSSPTADDVAPAAPAPKPPAPAVATSEAASSEAAPAEAGQAPTDEAAPAELTPADPAPAAEAPPAAVQPAYVQPTYPPPVYAPPPVAYSEPQSTFWSSAATFAGGAAVGGLLGYAIGDDWFDGDNDNNDDIHIDIDDDDWDDLKDRYNDGDLNGRLNGNDVNISGNNVIVAGDKLAKDKRDRMSRELQARRDGEKVAGLRGPDGKQLRPERDVRPPGSVGNRRPVRRRPGSRSPPVVTSG